MKLKLKDLLADNPEADLERKTLLTALYNGGKMFEQYKDHFIIKRQVETASGAEAGKYYAERKKRAQYINRCSGVVNWISATATKDNPRIVTDAPEGLDADFWDSLNTDADGSGTPFSSIVRQSVEDMLVKEFPYIEVKAEGNIRRDDYRLNVINTLSVLDYEIDENNKIEWIKTHVKTASRASAYSKADQVKNIITIYTDTDTFGYVFYGENDIYKDAAGNTLIPEAEISPSIDYSATGHKFGQVPIFRGNSTSFHFVLDRLSEPLKALYNAEIDLSFALAVAAYPQLFLKLEGKGRAESLVRSELSAVILNPNEEIGYTTPGNQAFDSLFKNIERIKASLLESMRMMSSEAAELPQAGRLSGDAIKQLTTPLQAMICAISYPVHDMLIDAINAIRDARGDTFNIWIEGFGDSDIDGSIDDSIIDEKDTIGIKSDSESEPEEIEEEE